MRNKQFRLIVTSNYKYQISEIITVILYPSPSSNNFPTNAFCVSRVIRREKIPPENKGKKKEYKKIACKWLSGFIKINEGTSEISPRR